MRVERASIDEAYLDLTSVIDKMQQTEPSGTNVKDLPNTHVVGWNNENDEKGLDSWFQSLSNEEFNERNLKLALAAALVEKMRLAVFEQTGFRCSAGIAANKMLAKLSCGIHKPNKQTVLPFESVEEFFRTFPLKKVRHLGGKLGFTLTEELNCKTMGDIVDISEKTLQQRFDQKTGNWLYWYCRGVDHELVSSRHLPKSIGCNKNFSGLAALDSRDKILHWLEELCAEVVERLEKDREANERTAKLLTVTVRLEGDNRPSSYARSIALPATYDQARMVTLCMSAISKENAAKSQNHREAVVTSLGVSASKFVSSNQTNRKIDRFFSRPNKTDEEIELPDESDIGQEVKHEATCSTTHISTDDGEKLAGNVIVVSPDVLSEEHLEENAPKITEDPKLKKKLGFFASRSVKKPETAAEKQEQFPSICISEIFPDLNDVDSETLILLPLEIQRKVRQEIELMKGGEVKGQTEDFVDCNTCGKTLLKEEIEEHRDYHLAMDLQKEISLEAASTSSTTSSTSSNLKVPSSKSNKRSFRQSKDKTSASNQRSKRSRTIESFFAKK